ncbi:hypothetical protein ACFFX1_55185 [Dactylosporangium sucinum]|uniref:Uncharacterized protein n=1 Tax=Dactylosporangium sucinum TaxID=1424081 RepID=A0A917U3S3_9ACTN|nr:hypothetical protein [Dactylosporangium sucinum]GGM52973.1 hypothetical protein GCM10007977_063230 [Dactylosporangium sucinum]
MSSLLAAAQALTDVQILAAPDPTTTPQPTGEVNTSGIVGWIATYIVPIILGGLAVVTMARAAKGNVSQTMTTSMIAIIGMAMLAGATTLFFFGDSIVGVLFK